MRDRVLHAIADVFFQDRLCAGRVAAKHAIEQIAMLARRRLIADLTGDHLIGEVGIEGWERAAISATEPQFGISARWIRPAGHVVFLHF